MGALPGVRGLSGGMWVPALGAEDRNRVRTRPWVPVGISEVAPYACLGASGGLEWISGWLCREV